MQATREKPQRLGLALSGGGFRASFFHLGVLARLAELGLLRQVDVISTVSGGTIVGAFYYLNLKKLLESNDDPTDEDYRKLVQDIETDFLAAVRKNVRARILLNPWKNYRMLGRKYSRSDRIGDLYDRFIYKDAWGEPGKRFLRDRQIQLRWLVTKPKGWKGEGPFKPYDHNKTLKAKVPILVMNATTLNTGHNWRFEAVRMGEPAPENSAAAEILSTIDVNERLAQAYFEPRPPEPTVPPSQQRFPLAKAVAASSCVPLLFPPLSISDMYPGWRVQLVDGGVHDNQGIQALFDMECDAAIVSDASGLMRDAQKPAPSLLSVASRAMSIYGSRVRIEQLVHAASELRPALMHLLSGVPVATVEPTPDGRKTPEEKPLTEYGINRTVQKCLARMRTDLDAFADVEAYSLMYSGYRMSAFELKQWAVDHPEVGPLMSNAAAEVSAKGWCFEPVADPADAEHPPQAYMRVLVAGRSLFFKSLLALPLAARLAAIAVLLAVTGAAVWAVVDNRGAIHDAFDWGWPSWWWVGLVVFLPAALSIFALLQLLGGYIYLRLGSAARLRK